MQKDTIFDVASVTKIVATATAAGICKDRGLLDPDAPMTKYLPDHQGKDADKISLRRLASHTSGFSENPRVSYAGKLTGDAIFARMLKDNPKWPVNSHYEYACRNLIYLSTIVEKVTQRSFGEFCTKEIFEPLEMRDSVFNRVSAEVLPRVAATHDGDHAASHNPDTIDAGRAIGNAGLFTTAIDLSHFCEMMLGDGEWHGKRILTPETIADFTRNDQLSQFPGRGFIWEMDLQSLHRPARMSDKCYGHSGFTGISVWIDPVTRVYGVVLTNRNHPKKISKLSKTGIEQYRARGRIVDAAMEAFGY
jgi:CubicO group peptidase (beta-lactamase class C family)